MKKNLFQPNYYVSIYDEMMVFFDISITQAWILVKVFNLSSKGMSQTTIKTGSLAAKLRVDDRTIQRNIKTLVEKGLITQMIIDRNKSRLRPSKEVCNQFFAWMAENETVKGLNGMAL